MTTDQLRAAQAVARAIADRLASPADVRSQDHPYGWWPQSLARGAAGIALLHIERARAGLGSWQRAHDWLGCAAHDTVISGQDSHLFYGAPALAFVLNAAADRPGRYARALHTLDHHIATTTRRRLERAHARADRGELPALSEFDAIRGLAGIGAHLLRREPHGDLVRAVLAYLVRLTEPVENDGELLPGWWSDLAPSGKPSPKFPGGHSNNGMAHGVAGILALLGLGMRNGIVVDGQTEAIERVNSWLDQWRQTSATGHWWPYWVTRQQLRDGRPDAGPSRPSWCYGNAGLARAQQISAIATGDTARQQIAECALFSALTDPGQLAATTDLTLCHGYAGLAHIAARAATDAITTPPAGCVEHLLDAILTPEADARRPAASLLHEVGLLEGATGIALALHTIQAGAPPVSGWDSCLLIN